VLAELDVFMLLSRYEGGPYAPLEAMRAGVPVVLTDVVGSRDVIEDGASGHLVPPAHPETAATVAVRLLDAPEDRSMMVKAAYLRLYRLFDRESMGEAHSRLYHRLAGVTRDQIAEPFPATVDVADQVDLPAPPQEAPAQSRSDLAESEGAHR
jgi:glycosyltransferase involved in cell wall biosynthesis